MNTVNVEIVKTTIPSMKMIEQERSRMQYREARKGLAQKIVYALLAVAAVAIIISLVFFPVLKVTGVSMEPTLMQGEIILGMKTATFETGDICSFRYENQQVIKRVIASAGDWVDIDEEGNVYVNSRLLDEPYVQEKSLGFNDLDYPYQVPEGTVFVLGDHRATSIDSRSNEMGPVAVDHIVGKVLWRIFPFGSIEDPTEI